MVNRGEWIRVARALPHAVAGAVPAADHASATPAGATCVGSTQQRERGVTAPVPRDLQCAAGGRRRGGRLGCRRSPAGGVVGSSPPSSPCGGRCRLPVRHGATVRATATASPRCSSATGGLEGQRRGAGWPASTWAGSPACARLRPGPGDRVDGGRLRHRPRSRTTAQISSATLLGGNYVRLGGPVVEPYLESLLVGPRAPAHPARSHPGPGVAGAGAERHHHRRRGHRHRRREPGAVRPGRGHRPQPRRRAPHWPRASPPSGRPSPPRDAELERPRGQRPGDQRGAGRAGRRDRAR